MNILQIIKEKIFKRNKLERLSDDPKGTRHIFINDEEKRKEWEIKENKVWYIGIDSELLNHYTERKSVSFLDNPVYNRNTQQYFWAKSALEIQIKRIHSPVAHIVCETISNIVGNPLVNVLMKDETGKDVDVTEVWNKIADENDFANKLTQQSRPMTLAVGFGAWKVNINPDLCDYPLVEYYDAEFVKYIYESGLLVGIIFKTFYKDAKGKDYVLLETRYIENKNSHIDYSFYILKANDELEELSMEKAKELFGIEKENQVIYGLNKILAVPSRFFYDALNQQYGRSILAGKIGLLDFYDEIWSQASQTNRVSTPVEYYSKDVIGRDSNGFPSVPNAYNRQFIMKDGIPNGDGTINNDVFTTQPDLNFDKYATLADNVLRNILNGVLSPATLGIDVAKKDNADAQREKEKVSIETRNNIIVKETKEIRELVTICLMLQEYIKNGVITLRDYDIQVKYNEFANPSFENELQILGQAWANGEISTEKYVDLLWQDKITEDDKKKEIAWLDSNRQQFDMESILNGNGEPIKPDVQSTEEGEEIPS